MNLISDKQEKAFGGIPYDLELLKKSQDGSQQVFGPGPGGDALGGVVLLLLPFADLPLSFVGDLLTYPLARWLDSQAAPRPKPPAIPPAPPESRPDAPESVPPSQKTATLLPPVAGE
jgi:hypothetical protein